MKPVTGFAAFIAAVFSNSHRDIFLVRLGTNLLLTKWGIVGPLADFLGIFVRGILGLASESGIFQIDLAINALREGMKLKEFERDAKKAYEKASAKVYSEAEKVAIRKQYLEIISRFGNVGDRPK